MKNSQQPLPNEEAVKCELAAEFLRSSGRLRLQVSGWSMFPAIQPGDVLNVERIDSGEISPGDVILFERDRRLFVHRVIRKSFGDSNILTRGDAMPQADPVVSETKLLGKVVAIARNGRTMEPQRRVPLKSRALAAVFRSSQFGARVVVGVHGIVHSSN